MLAIEVAAEGEAETLHRDISIGNVMLRERNGSQTGLLADWDHAKVFPKPAANNDVEYKNQLYRTVRILSFSSDIVN